MSLIKDMLSSDESLFKNEVALDYSFIPKLIPYREPQQRYIASCIKPLFNQRNGKNVFIYGQPGVGKTVACRHIFKELEEETDDVIPIYINCWQKNTTFKIVIEICDALGYKFTHNKKTEELFNIIKSFLNKKSVVFAFDEIDKVEDLDFLYSILEEIYRKTILLITNYKTWLNDLDERIKSRLLPEMLEFQPYDAKETRGILKHRMNYAFVPGVWGDDAFELVVAKTAEIKDIRSGLTLLKNAATLAEDESSRNVSLKHAQEAIRKFDDSNIKKSSDLVDDEKFILETIKENPSMKIGDLYNKYKEKGGIAAYRTFQRRIDKLKAGSFILVEKISGGKDGNTTIIKCLNTKKLTEF